ncbi:DUF4097 family beta strand repeat-containing protein [Planomonospora sp. ID82291]|uniref:DUF4097 family beta strand repeat-containing protein n=1 Tax=Planomonospora sp. ID82291 TaxID=2738136 RepID=UPI0018C4225C|nr:DUF4097 family beta strand repeat-containing protein [Planomonospora sp. ID82291]MBG0815973.1 DUF4097 family beta strand repeat protein [Planomonospora sp. ID82291]
MKKNIPVAGALLGTVLVLSACGIATQQTAVSYDVTDEVLVLSVDAQAGDIVVNESARSGIRVTETLHWNNDKPKTEHSVDGGTLTLKYDCPSGFGVVSCSVDYKVEIPKGLRVQIETGAGDITLRSLTGEVEAGSGAGDIEASGLAGKAFVADTGAGDIEAGFTAAPDRVDVETGAGDATVRLPKGPYRVDVSSGAGDETVKVDKDPSAARTVKVSSGAGDAKVLPA